MADSGVNPMSRPFAVSTISVRTVAGAANGGKSTAGSALAHAMLQAAGGCDFVGVAGSQWPDIVEDTVCGRALPAAAGCIASGENNSASNKRHRVNVVIASGP